jgi:hypothetical protein
MGLGSRFPELLPAEKPCGAMSLSVGAGVFHSFLSRNDHLHNLELLFGRGR